VLEELLEKVPGFRQAYLKSGLSVHEYEEYGPVEYFRNMFVSAWKNVSELAGKRRVELGAMAGK
jgi:hypothetical protein